MWQINQKSILFTAITADTLLRSWEGLVASGNETAWINNIIRGIGNLSRDL